MAGKNIYFASDFHLGAPDNAKSREREKIIVSWLNSIASDAKEIYLVGDVFDFWFEHTFTAPKGFVRLLGTLANMADNGIQLHLITGNHDMWTFGYLQEETGMQVHKKPITKEWNNTKFYIAHGDGLGPGDYSYKMIKKLFKNSFFIWLFSRLHPNFSFWIARKASKTSRNTNAAKDNNFLDEDKEWLIAHAKSVLKNTHYHYFIFGHRHWPLQHKLEDNSTYINLGDWINHFTYGVWNGKQFALQNYKPQ